MDEKKEIKLEVNKVNNVVEDELELQTKNNEVVDKENKPSQEEIEEAKKEFNEAAASFSTKIWDIGDEKNATKICKYIKKFINERFPWSKNGWMGIIKMNEEIDDILTSLKNKEIKNVKLTYQPLEFLFYAFSNPGSVGLKSAQDFEKEQEIFSLVLTKVSEALDDARKELKAAQYLQEKWAAYEQGFYLERLEENLDEESKSEESQSKMHVVK